VTVRRPALAPGALVFVAVLCAYPAAAEDTAAIVKHGIELRVQGKDREALAEFERARAIKETPRIVAQIGLAEYALGLWLPSAEHLAAALKEERDPWIQKNRAALSKAAAAVADHLGTVEVWGGPAGAEVVINGKHVGTLPSVPAVRVVAGTCSMLVTASGFEDLTRTIKVDPGQLVRENVQLVARRVVTDPATVAAPRQPAPQPQPLLAAPASPVDPASQPATDPSEPSPGILHRPWFWVAVGVVVAGAVTAAVLLSRSDSGGRCPDDTVCPQ
jgi:hypothetical protein